MYWHLTLTCKSDDPIQMTPLSVNMARQRLLKDKDMARNWVTSDETSGVCGHTFERNYIKHQCHRLKIIVILSISHPFIFTTFHFTIQYLFICIHINWRNKHSTKGYLCWYNFFRQRNYWYVFHNFIQFEYMIYQAPSSPTFLLNLRFNLKLTIMRLSAKNCNLRNFKILDDGGAWYKNTQQYFLKLWKYLRYMYLHLVLSPLVNQAQFTPLGNQCTGLSIQVDHCPAARSRWQTWIHIIII